MSTPALQRLREAKPEASITLLSHENLLTLAGTTLCRRLSSLLPKTKACGEWRVGSGGNNFDVGIAFPNSIRAALQLPGARIFHNASAIGGGAETLLLNKVIPRRTDAVEMHKKSDAEVERDSGCTEGCAFAKVRASHSQLS